MSIFSKLQEARFQLSQAKLKKTGHNTYSKYDYFELEDITPSITKVCHDLGLCPVFNTGQNEATLTIIDSENPSDYLTFSMDRAEVSLKGAPSIHNKGAEMTYLRRYLYMIAFEISEKDITESGAAGKKPASGSKVKKPSNAKAAKLENAKEEIIAIMGEAINSGVNKDELYAIVEQHSGDKNPKKIADIETCDKIKDSLKEFLASGKDDESGKEEGGAE